MLYISAFAAIGHRRLLADLTKGVFPASTHLCLIRCHHGIGCSNIDISKRLVDTDLRLWSHFEMHRTIVLLVVTVLWRTGYVVSQRCFSVE